MVRNHLKKFAFVASASAAFIAADAMASDYTDVLDAADQVYLENENGQIELVDDAFDISLTPSFKQRQEWAKLKREYEDPDRNTTRELNELEYRRITSELDLDLEIGLFHDLSITVSMPIVFSDQRKYKFDSVKIYKDELDSDGKPKFDRMSNAAQDSYFAGTTNVGYDANGLSYIADGTHYKFFDLENDTWLDGAKRSGIGDMTFGIHWNPYNTERNYIPERPWQDETGRSTMLLAFDYTAPTGKMSKIDNKGVGNGVHELKFKFAASHRFKYIDPYIGVIFGLPIETDSAYHDYGANQKRKGPGMWGRADIGAEFIPYEHMHKDYQRFVKFDLGLSFKYTAEGRAYSELGDAFATSNCYKHDGNGIVTPECSWIQQKWSNGGTSNVEALAKGNYNGELKEDAIFDYDGYGVLGASLRMTIQPVQYVQILAGASFDYTQDHFITFTKAGRDVRKDAKDKDGNPVTNGTVDLSDTEERNPVYSHVLDRPGNRIKRTESFALDWFVGLKLMY